ncbi:hypothetical protein OMAG_001444 [Candidatus Omnitrophus magneticus]|uniref:Uncharacterized protein n=1 Tax=Candidatus Omnitrophus magneticus TaxID=1609969 RepID=A0A0F0CMY8_9BACT|nr:hypothetical protein OMAG_001444 [Candidatus Omnitrophus magneticus]
MLIAPDLRANTVSLSLYAKFESAYKLNELSPPDLNPLEEEIFSFIYSSKSDIDVTAPDSIATRDNSEIFSSLIFISGISLSSNRDWLSLSA